MSINITMTDLINKVVDALINDADLLTFCLDHYQKRGLVIVGYDSANPAESNDYPLICMDVFQSSGFGASPRNHFEIDLYCGVEQEKIDESSSDNTRIYRGVMEAEMFRHLAYKAIFKNNFGKISIKGDTEQAAWFPRFVSAMTLEIETINSRGRI